MAIQRLKEVYFKNGLMEILAAFWRRGLPRRRV